MQDVERVDEIEERAKAAKSATLLPFTDAGARNLSDELAAVEREINQPAGRSVGGMSLAKMRTFPGMPDYKKPVS